MNRSRKAPIAAWLMPTINACRTAAATYSRVPGTATMLAPVATNNESIATGPTDNCREVPNMAYATSGSTEAYRPTTGGKPASMAYAMPCGMSITAIVTPAAASDGKSALTR